MLHIIWGILKIIGFLLLLVFLLLLTIILAVLFVPIRYQALADLHGEIFAEGKVTWLLHMVSVVVAFRKKQLEYSVKIFGISIVSSEEKKKTSVKTPASTMKSSSVEKGSSVKKESVKEEEEDDEVEPEILMNEEITSEPVTVEKTVPEPQKSSAKSPVTPKEEVKSSGEKKSIQEKFSDLIRNISDVIENIKEKIRNIRQTVDDLKKKIEKVKKFLCADATKKTLNHGKREIIYLLRHISPRRLEGDIRFGLDDPGSTGQILGYLSILQGLTGNHLHVEGVFDEKVTEGNVFLKGHIRLCHFVKILLSMLLDRNVRITIKRLIKMRA